MDQLLFWNRETIESLTRFGGKTIVVMGHDILGVGENSLEAQKCFQEEIDQRERGNNREYIPTKPLPRPKHISITSSL